MYRPKPRLIWRIFSSFLVIILISLGVVTWYATSYFKSFFLQDSEKELMVRALLLEERFSRAFYQDGLTPEQIDALCKKVGQESQARITVILESGEVIGDTFARVETMENHRGRPEVDKALAMGKGVTVRYSATLDKNMMYVALPMHQDRSARQGQVPAIIRTAVSISDIDTRIARVRDSILLALVLTIAAAAGASLYLSRRITKPVEQMRRGAEAFSKGDLSNRLPAPDTLELSELARAMNAMAQELDKKIRDVKDRSRELEAVHESMQEGVIAVDQEERIITVNTAASRIFDFPPETLKGENILEVARSFELQSFIQRALSTHEPVEDDLTLDREERLILHIHSTALYDSSDRRMGTLIIFRDITRIRLLERMHKDFAANVSHELKTPLTTIKGFVETLREMAENPSAGQEMTRFLLIVEKNVNRMIDLINDLLALSRLERLKGTDVTFAHHPLATLLSNAVALCRDQAGSKKIELRISCPESLKVMADPILMEQAVFNLLDNAIKYSPEGRGVFIEADRSGEWIQIRVRDTGLGIDRTHLPKLFSRFYRIDKGRSRNQGGTGLGLAIVKHIVLYHKGRIEVESTLGKGSCFTITIPA